MEFLELDEKTREYMLKEFEKEEAGGDPYRSEKMTELGLESFPDYMVKAIKDGNEVSLAADLVNPSFWQSYETYKRAGNVHERKINPEYAAKRLALTEFNTWYVRGLAKRLMDEGEKQCEIYRAESAKVPKCECTSWEGSKFDLEKVYNGHRIRYHHKNIDRTAFSIPSGPLCHHSISRL